MLVSVIMSVHNGAEFLERSVESILSQTNQDFEFIICDDASTDETYEILVRYRNEDSRFIIIQNDANLGLAASLNRCLEKATGEYIARMDDDDISLPTRFEEEIDFLRKNPEYAFVSCNAIMFTKGNDNVGMNKKPEIPTKNQIVHGSPYLHPATMFRRDVIIGVGGYSKEYYAQKRAQDYELFMRMSAQGLNGYNIQKPLFKYYYSPKAALKKHSFKSTFYAVVLRYKGYRMLKVKPWQYIKIFIPVYVNVKRILKNSFSAKRKSI